MELIRHSRLMTKFLKKVSKAFGKKPGQRGFNPLVSPLKGSLFGIFDIIGYGASAWMGYERYKSEKEGNKED